MGNVDFYDHLRKKNIVLKFLSNKYLEHLTNYFIENNISNCLDVGAGKGAITSYLKDKLNLNISALDNNIEKISFFESQYSNIPIFNQDATNMLFSDNSFNLLLATEVLEHQDNPNEIIEEMRRVSGKYCIFSVPNEPYWMMGNFIRGKHFKDFGNSPGHVQHWGKRNFYNYLSSFFSEVEVNSVYVWNFALCKK